MAQRILYVASNMQHINNFHLDYIAALRAEGHTVAVMARGEGADYDLPFEKKLFASENRRARARVKQILREMRPDTVVLNTTLAAFHVRMAMKRKNRPRVVNFVHGYLFSPHINRLKSALFLLCEKLTASRCDAILTMNKEDERTAVKHKLTSGEIYFTRGMGALVRPQMHGTDQIRSEFSLNGKYVMCFVGELSARKNQAFLISALPEIAKAIPEAVLVLVGDGGERQSLSALSESLGVADRVIFTGSRADGCDLMRACDLYVSAASVEGMPFNLIEAMGCGCRVLASRIKGHADLIEDGKDGFLYEFGNADEFVNKTCQIYNKSIDISVDAVSQKYEMYSKDQVFEETLGILKKSIGEV